MTVGAQQRKTVDFGVKSHFAWKSLLQSFFCLKTVSGKAFIDLTNRAKIIGVPEILDQSYRVGGKSPIYDLFSLVATQP